MSARPFREDARAVILLAAVSPDVELGLAEAVGSARVAVLSAITTEEILARARESQPDLILVDLAFDARGGVSTAATLHQLFPDSALLVSATPEHGALVAHAERFDLGPFVMQGPPWPPLVYSAMVAAAQTARSLRLAVAPLRLKRATLATSEPADFNASVVEYEIALIRRALLVSAGVVRRAGRLLGISEGTLRGKMSKYTIQTPKRWKKT